MIRTRQGWGGSERGLVFGRAGKHSYRACREVSGT
jgi:hypothetical protein